ncbi:MAG: TetR/AcrR family transcriptional regulator [Methylobacteriaceae bacterium]|nr:TetR/AcrR family transcriptional regulator [Methylobacteriaceae bacterium]
MVYPSKTSAGQIREAALAIVASEGAAALSMRTLAGRVGVAPNALYRYFADRDALIAALAEAGLRELLEALREAAAGRSGFEVFESVADRYLAFAAEHPALYPLMMSSQPAPASGRPAHEDLWSFVSGLAAELAGPDGAAGATLALWSYLHGLAELERAGLFGSLKPRETARAGLSALLRGLAAAPEPVRT